MNLMWQSPDDVELPSLVGSYPLYDNISVGRYHSSTIFTNRLYIKEIMLNGICRYWRILRLLRIDGPFINFFVCVYRLACFFKWKILNNVLSLKNFLTYFIVISLLFLGKLVNFIARIINVV